MTSSRHKVALPELGGPQSSICTASRPIQLFSVNQMQVAEKSHADDRGIIQDLEPLAPRELSWDRSPSHEAADAL